MPIKRTLWRSLLLASGLMATTGVWAQNNGLRLKATDGKPATVLTPTDTTHLNYYAQIRQLPLLGTGSVSLGSYTAPWLTATMQSENVVRVLAQSNYSDSDRVVNIPLLVNGAQGGQLIVKQASFDPAVKYSLYSLPISSATGMANSDAEGIAKSYDGLLSTIYHSPYYSTNLPLILEYTLANAGHVDQLVYTPRQDNNMNGNWGYITVSYSTESAPNTFTTLGRYDLAYSKNTTAIDLGTGGIDDVKKVRIKVETGFNNLASAAEVAFVQDRVGKVNTMVAQAAQTIFTDELCSALRPGVTATEVETLTDPLLKSIAYTLLKGNYSTEFRRNTFEPYYPVETLRRELKMQHPYNSYENPTGIYFEANKSVVVFVRGIKDGHAPALKIKNWGKANSSERQYESSYTLKNGINVITPAHRGNGYVSYYDKDYKTMPNVEAHFYNATVNGYFDPNEGHDNAKWKTMLANATSDIMDMRGAYVQMAYPTDTLRKYCPNDGLAVVQHSDSTVRRSREVLGFYRYNLDVQNRQFSHVVWGDGFMWADDTGANVGEHYLKAWTSPSSAVFDFWAYGHELGHNSQLVPDFKYAGLGETSNNILSAWAQFNLSTANYYRLESEVIGQNNYSKMKGGRFNCYLEEGVRKGVSWQLQSGPDYSGDSFRTVTVKNKDYDGNEGNDTVVKTKNFDHFVKLVPLWQLQLYCHQAGFSPDIWAKLNQTWRTTTLNNGTPSSGKYQIRFMQLVCDSTGMDFLPFFEKAGFLRPINAYIEDYSPDWLKIDQKMIDDLKKYVADKGYRKLDGVPEYISALNWKTYRDRLAIPNATVNSGTRKGSERVTVQHSVWQNVVAFETYDASNKLTAISMQGLGGDAGNTYTQVLFPSGSKRIDAVSWDGKRITCYQE